MRFVRPAAYAPLHKAVRGVQPIPAAKDKVTLRNCFPWDEAKLALTKRNLFSPQSFPFRSSPDLPTPPVSRFPFLQPTTTTHARVASAVSLACTTSPFVPVHFLPSRCTPTKGDGSSKGERIRASSPPTQSKFTDYFVTIAFFLPLPSLSLSRSWKNLSLSLPSVERIRSWFDRDELEKVEAKS